MLSRIFHKKQQLYKEAPVTFITCSQRLRGQAEKSALPVGGTAISVPNPINTSLFKPRDKKETCCRCHLPQGGKLILFGLVKITDKREDINYLIELCKLLADRHPELKESLGVVVFGKQSEQLKSLLPFRVYPLNYASNEHEPVGVYNAVDLFIIPSLEGNLSNTIMEAMACGTPRISFNADGIPEMIDRLYNGYVVQYRSSKGFANGICWAPINPDYPSLPEQANWRAIADYLESIIAKRYIDVYNRIAGRYA